MMLPPWIPKISVYSDQVQIDTTYINRPPYVSVKEWIEYWEWVRNAEGLASEIEQLKRCPECDCY